MNQPCMTPQQMNEVKKAFSALAEMYQKPAYTDAALKMIASLLGDLPFERVSVGITEWCKTNRFNRPPTPGELREIISPKDSEKDNARLIAAKIIGCISRFGYTWSHGVFMGGILKFNGGTRTFDSFDEAIKSELGEVGAEVVRIMGGWTTLCEREANDSTSTIQAQLRDLTESVMIKAKNGTLTTPTALPTSTVNSIGEGKMKELVSSMKKENL